MTTFLFDVLKELYNTNTNVSNITFILPSKRAGLFLKHQLATIVENNIFSPEIVSIETFVEQLSELKNTSNTSLLFEFYSTYIELTDEKNRDAFDTFSKWAQILLQDFNEIDRYLIPHKQIFDYLSAIQDLKHWSLEEHKTEFVKNYLAFWKRLGYYYNHFTNHLLNKKIGYQGLIYREAVENLEAYIQNNQGKQHVFLGFNALNTSEETIIQELLQNDLAKIYWDIDATFFNNNFHDAGLFSRAHKEKWTYYKKHAFNWVTTNYSKEKNVSIFGIPKSIGQAKYIGTLLKDLQKNNETLKSTAVVLGDENLLIPVLNSIPLSVKGLNITMGFPLKSIPLTTLFDALFHLHKITSKSFYSKDVITIISHKFIRPLLVHKEVDYASRIIEIINRNNIIYITKERLKEIATEPNNGVITLLFSNWDISVNHALNNCSQLIMLLKHHLNDDKSSNLLPLEYLFRFNQLFNELTRLNTEYPNHIKDINTLFGIYRELLSTETLDFQGEPLQGLQIMGMLESRVLDFETVIISSVNEGILPAGKSNNSFIPFDVKLENNLPTYKEKDAIYTYHFYRLLQRAKNVFILYNTEADVLTGGEKSRFITQLELEGIHDIKHQIIAPKVPRIVTSLSVVKKTKDLQEHIIKMAGAGFSPSSLTNYIRNPIDFYYQSILKIKQHSNVEETVASNTLGTIIHNTLEDFYQPLIGDFLSVEIIKKLKLKIEGTISFHFRNEYKEGNISKGKNLIIFEIAKRYIFNFLNLEITSLKEGNTIKILAIEANNEITISIPEVEFPVKIKGKVDRVDEFNGVTRVVDYKTGNVQQNQLEVVNWEDITEDYTKYSKSFQILTYTYLMNTSNQLSLPIEAGIISFKNLKGGFLNSLRRTALLVETNKH